MTANNLLSVCHEKGEGVCSEHAINCCYLNEVVVADPAQTMGRIWFLSSYKSP